MIGARLLGHALPAWQRLRSSLDRRERHRATGFDRRRAELYVDLWRRAASALGADVDEVGYGYLRITKGSRSTMVREHQVMLDSAVALNVAGNKPLVHRLLAARRLPVPHYAEFDLDTLGTASGFLRERRRPAVVKPADGGAAGRGVTTQVHSERDLRAAARWASRFGRKLLVEDQHAGHSYRLLYLGGSFIDAVLREGPVVRGDGRRTIAHLLEDETAERLTGPTITALTPLTVDPETRFTLRGQRLRLAAVPAAGRAVRVKQVVNQNTARENHVVRDRVHPSVLRLCGEIAAALGLQLMGIDLMTTDIGMPLGEAQGVINEVNTTPGLHHHVLVAEPARAAPVAESILEYLLRQTP